MKTMEELVIDRLIEEVSRPLRAELDEVRKELATTKQTLQSRENTLAKESADRKKLQNEAAASDKPLSDFYYAAGEVLRFNDAPRSVLRVAISKLGYAMAAAEKYIDQIPF